MKFVNTQSRIIYNSAVGKVNPGATTVDRYKDLEKCLQKVIDICGKNFSIILNDHEAQMIAKIMELDKAGTNFDPSVIPLEIRNDPVGINRLNEATRKKQHAAIEANAKANKEAAEREAMINGEVEDKPKIRPIGINRSAEDEKKGMTGFEKILAENARIANKKQEQAPEEQQPVNESAEEKGEEVTTPPAEGAAKEQQPVNESAEEKGGEVTAPPAEGAPKEQQPVNAPRATAGKVAGKAKSRSKK
jgi:hypothetical protein